MSYDISIVSGLYGSVISLPHHNISGGTYAVGGTTEAYLSVTYNYASHFQSVLGKDGIRSIDGMEVRDSLPILRWAASRLEGKLNPDYWAATGGNACAALMDLILLGVLADKQRLSGRYSTIKWKVG